jgi:type II secretory pathway pseudopilin PulG
MFMLALLVLSMAVAAPRVRDDIQRDRDLETMHRGKQYIRAIQLYYRKFNAYPPNVDALVKTNEIRFLRKKYVDPTTGKDEWKPVLFGQNKTPTAIGFFGQPLGGSSIAGIGPSGGNGLGGANGGNGLNPGGTSSLFNSGPGSTFGSNNSGNATNPTDPNAAGGNGLPGANGTGTGGTDASGAAAGGPGNGASGPGTGTGGQSFGGAGIIGFSPGSPKQSILVYKKKNHYNEWEFTYDPIQERMQAGMTGGNTGAIGQPASSTTTPVGGIGPTATPVPAPAPTNTPQ